MAPTLQADPDCARPVGNDEPAGANDPAGGRHAGAESLRDTRDHPLLAERRAFADIDPATWDALAALNPHATPFSSWAFHRAWWDAYGANAHDETVVVIDPTAAGAPPPIAIVPLMERHVVEPSDAETHTFLRHQDGPALTPVAPTACAMYFGASYHADYATILARPSDLSAIAEALADAVAHDDLASPQRPAASAANHGASAANHGASAASRPDPGAKDHEPWAVLDLRRLRQGDPAIEALSTAFGRREIAEGWTLNVELEDVCPVIRIPAGTTDIDDVLATLGKKERHEIRRKVRRAEAAGPVDLVESTDPLADLDAFIELHQARWGAHGLFPPTPGGDQSRRFIRRLFELFDSGRAVEPGRAVLPGSADRPTIHLGFLTVAGKRIGAEIHFETADSVMYYNAGIDPDARDLSPGVVLLERLVRRAIERGKSRVDMLRGDEPYKYEWGAIDEPIQRILVRRAPRHA